MGSLQSGSDHLAVTGDAIVGHVHGGQQPVVGSTVQLWAVGATGYGSAATKLGSSVLTLSDGSFSLGAYTCPSSTTQTYITASGGNPGLGANNPNIMLAAALGNCSSLSASTYIFMDEVTTAAAAFALGQYFTPTFGTGSSDSFGAPNTTQAQAGLTNAFATVNNLVNFTTGNAVVSATLTGAGSTITTTPESAKLYTIANILAACVNSAGGASADGSNCGTLFADVAPTSATPPTDTLQAAVYMSLNPTSNNTNGSTANLTALYTLPPSTAPYPGLTAQPTDWTIGILYSGSTSTILEQPRSLAADAAGNIWIISGTTDNQFTELSPTGTPLVNLTTVGGVALSGLSPRNIAIDTNGNVWFTTSSSSGDVFEYVPGGTSPTPIGLGKASYGLAIDGNNNVFVGEESSSSTFELAEFVGGVLNATTNEVRYPLVGQTSVGTYNTNTTLEPEYMAFDTSTPANLWISSGSAAVTATNDIYQLSNINYTTACGPTPFTATCSSNTSSSTVNTYTAITAGTLNAANGLAAGYNGTTPTMWAANGGSGANSLDLLSLSSNSAAVASGAAYGNSTYMSGPFYVAVDGAGNAWSASSKQTSPGSVVEISSGGTILTPNNTGTTPFNVFGYSHVGITTGTGVAVDPSGNVWVANNLAGGTSGSAVFEIVGAAAPTVTPIALALNEGKVAQKP